MDRVKKLKCTSHWTRTHLLYVSSPPLNLSQHLPGLESQRPEFLGSPGCKENFFAPSKALRGGLCGIYGAYLGSSLTWVTYFCTTLLLGFTLHMKIPFRKEEGSYFVYLHFFLFLCIYLFIYLFCFYFLFQKDYSFFNMFYNENNFFFKLYFCLI